MTTNFDNLREKWAVRCRESGWRGRNNRSLSAYLRVHPGLISIHRLGHGGPDYASTRPTERRQRALAHSTWARACADAAYRAREFAAIVAAERRAAAAQTVPGVIHAVDTRTARRSRLLWREQVRQRRLDGLTGCPPERMPGAAVRVGGPVNNNRLAAIRRRTGGRVLGDWTPIWSASYFEHADGQTEWKNGRPRNYTRAVNTLHVRSWAVLCTGGSIDYVFDQDAPRRLVPPTDCQWVIVDHKLSLVLTTSRADDYHPSAQELIDYQAEQLRAKLLANRDLRLKMAAEKAAAAAELAGVFVCAADSLTAGNCRTETQSWLRRHNLRDDQHLPALEVLRLAEEDARVMGDSAAQFGRVRLALTAATLRTRRETERGYAVLAEHRLPA